MGSDERANPHALRTAVSLPEIVHDALGRELAAQSIVLITSPVVARVHKVSRALNPGLPPNVVEVEFHAVIRAVAPAAGVMSDVYLLQHAVVKPPEGVKDGEQPKTGLIVVP